MQVWEQEVAWTEADKPIKLAARALTLPHDHKLNQAPIFCFETMMHMLYWSCLVYDYKRVRLLWVGCLLFKNLQSRAADKVETHVPKDGCCCIHAGWLFSRTY